MGSWHEEHLRVRYEETDTMGVVYYAKFLVWMEVGRVSLFRDIKFGYSEWKKQGLQFPVVQAHADYRASARFDDQILIKTRVAKVGSSSMRFENKIYEQPGMKLLCTGHTVHVLLDMKGRTTPVSPELRRLLTSS